MNNENGFLGTRKRVVIIESENWGVFVDLIMINLGRYFRVNAGVVYSISLGEDYGLKLKELKSTDVFFIGYVLNDNHKVDGPKISAFLRGLCPDAYIVGWTNRLYDESEAEKAEKEFLDSGANIVVDKIEGLKTCNFISMMTKALATENLQRVR